MININDQILFHLSNLNKENLRITYQTTANKILQNGSDNTAIFSRELYFEDKLRVYRGVQTQINHADIANKAVDSTLASVKLGIELIQTDMIKSLNAGFQQSDKIAIATTFEGIRENLFDWANTNINDEYIFAGSDSTIQPFVKDEITGRITYVGDNVLKQVPIEPDSYRDRGTTGFDAFMYTSDRAILNENLEFLASERIIDTDGNTWDFPETSGVGEKLDFFATPPPGVPTDIITDNNGTVWTVNFLNSTLENTSAAVPPVTVSIDLVKFNGGYQFENNLSDSFTDALGNPVTSFTAVVNPPLPPTAAGEPQVEIRQYDKYGNLTGQVLNATEIDNGDGIVGPGPDDTGLLEPRYRTDIVTDPTLALEAKHNMFDDLDIIITALNGVDAAGAPITAIEQNDIIRGMLDEVTQIANAVSIAHSQVGSRGKIIIDASVSISAKISNFNILAIDNGYPDVTALALEAKSLEITYTSIYSTISRMQNLNLVSFLN